MKIKWCLMDRGKCIQKNNKYIIPRLAIIFWLIMYVNPYKGHRIILIKNGRNNYPSIFGSFSWCFKMKFQNKIDEMGWNVIKLHLKIVKCFLIRFFLKNLNLLFLIFHLTKKTRKTRRYVFYMDSFLKKFSTQLLRQKLIIRRAVTAFS